MFWKQWAYALNGPCGWNWHDGPRKADQSETRGEGRWGSGGFGVRRPLRYMARQLDLDEEQVTELAAILDDLKTERAQARVDHRKAVSSIADAFLADSYDAERVREATAGRADSGRRVEEAVARALERTFKLLDPEQRKRLAYLLRSGGLTI